MRKPPAIVLLAEDNETDIELTRLSIEQAGIPMVSGSATLALMRCIAR